MANNQHYLLEEFEWEALDAFIEAFKYDGSFSVDKWNWWLRSLSYRHGYDFKNFDIFIVACVVHKVNSVDNFQLYDKMYSTTNCNDKHLFTLFSRVLSKVFGYDWVYQIREQYDKFASLK